MPAFLDLNAGYIITLSVRKLSKQYTYDILNFLYEYYTLIRIQKLHRKMAVASPRQGGELSK